MALNLLNGQMLNSTLERDGVNLSIINTANSTPLLYLDVANNRVGINTSADAITATFTINGNAVANNLELHNSLSTAGNISTFNFVATGNANAVNISASGNINAFANITGSNINAINLSATGNTVLSSLSVAGTANIGNLFATNFSSTGNSTAVNLSVAGTVTANNFVALQTITAVGTITGNVLSAVGNINTPNLYVSTTAVLPNITGLTNGNVNISAAGTGKINLHNLAVNNTTITSTSPTSLVTIGGTGAMTVPTGTLAQRPVAAPVGSLRFNTDLEELETWDGATWNSSLTPQGNPGTISDQQITPDGISTIYTLNQSATENNVLVFFNGVLQYPGTAYSVSDTTITFAQAPLSGDNIDIRFVAYTTSVSALENGSGTAFVSVRADSSIEMATDSAVRAMVDANGVFNIVGPGIKLPVYTVATAATILAPQVGQVIYVSDGASGVPCLAVYSDGTWKRVAFGATISAT
jgi:hypothetical protein